MDMIERRIRDAVATVLSRGAKALEQTASELERAAGELRDATEGGGEGPEDVWSRQSRPDADTITRSAPLRAVPDSPTDGSERFVPPVRPPRTPGAAREGDVDADVVAPADAPDLHGAAAPDRMRDLASATVSEIRAQLDELSLEELRDLRDIEVNNRNRTTLLTAIDRALDAG